MHGRRKKEKKKGGFRRTQTKGKGSWKIDSTQRSKRWVKSSFADWRENEQKNNKNMAPAQSANEVDEKNG